MARHWLSTPALFACSLLAPACADDGASAEGNTNTSTSSGTSASSGTGTGVETSTSTSSTTTETGGTETGTSETGEPEPEPLDCGTPSYEGLRRAPYLQSMSDLSARIAWASEIGGVGTVKVSPSADGPWTEIAAIADVYPTDYTNEEVEYTAFDATVTGLEAGTQYCYEVLINGEVVASGLKFETAWNDSRPVRIVAMGDSGNASPEQFAVRDRMLEGEFDIFLHLGDMAYGDGTFPEFKERMFDVYRDMLHGVPSWPTMGNHEYKTDEGQPYLDVYYLPEVAYDPADNERYYSFDYGDVHFVSVETNDFPLIAAIALDGSSDTTMMDWLRDDLAASEQPWKIAFFHHPPYTSSERDPNFVVRTGLLPILEEGGVDIALAGHDHHYERTVAMKNNAISTHEEGGIFYFVAGAGGAGLRPATGDWWTAAVNDEKHNYLSLTIEGCTAYGEVIALDGELLDSFELPGC